VHTGSRNLDTPINSDRRDLCSVLGPALDAPVGFLLLDKDSICG
jgi:hypothetical protein